MNETNRTEAETIQEIAISGINPLSNELASEAAYAIVPAGYKLEDLEKFHGRPRRIQQRVSCTTIESLLGYYAAFGDDGSMIFADPDRLIVEAVIDYHRAETDPAWCQHRAVCKLPETTGWANWTKFDNRKMSQTEFAEFIEDNAGEIASPSATEMLEVARNLQAQRKVEFASRVDLTNGDLQFTYETETQAKGNIHVPERFTVGLKPFQGAAPYEVEARLRYRISDDGKLTMWYSLLRPDVVKEDAFGDVVKQLREATDPDRVILGTC